MAEDKYTWDDLIYNPNLISDKDFVGKKVYYADSPSEVLDYANKDYHIGTLIEINKQNLLPFVVEYENDAYGYGCIIVKKKDPKPQYVPFKSAEEFISAYDKADDMIMSSTESKLSCFGMWLMCDEHYESVTCIYNNGITIDDVSINWNTLFESYTFLNGTPCGKEVKDE